MVVAVTLPYTPHHFIHTSHRSGEPALPRGIVAPHSCRLCEKPLQLVSQSTSRHDYLHSLSCKAAVSASLKPGLATADRCLLHRASKSFWPTHLLRSAAALLAKAPAVPVVTAAAAPEGLQGSSVYMLTGGGCTSATLKPFFTGRPLSRLVMRSACRAGHNTRSSP